MAMNAKTVGILTARPGKIEELKALLTGMAEPSRAEAGNLRYELWQDQANPARFVLDEVYTDNCAIKVHRATAHYQKYLANIEELAERNAILLDPVDIGDPSKMSNDR